MFGIEFRRITGNRTAWLAGTAAVALMWVLLGREISKTGVSFGEVVKQSMAEEMGASLCDMFVPVISFTRRKPSAPYLFERQVEEIMPLYGYAMEWQEILLAEGREEEGSHNGDMSDSQGEGFGSALQFPAGNTHYTDNADDAGSGNYAGNGDYAGNGAYAANGNYAGYTDSYAGDGAQAPPLDDMLRAENEAAMYAMMELENGQMRSPIFIPHTAQKNIVLEEFSDYESLVSRFYTIDSNTMAGSDQLNAALLAGKDMTIDKSAPGPQILIYHTHSQEGFADSVPGDESTTIVGVGDRLAAILEEQYGYQVLHHKGKYDVDSRDDAYAKSLPALEQVLAENPSIQVVIDLHRDQMPEETRLVMDVDGRPTARFMFFNGLSRTRKTGNISYLYNENQEDNLAFSFQMQLKAESYYPGLARKIYLKGYRYNMHLRPRTLLIELGAQNNTLEEELNACDPIAHILDMVLSGE